MAEPHGREAAEIREARRAMLVDALRALPRADDHDAAAASVMRALDAYIEVSPGRDTGLARQARDRMRRSLADLPDDPPTAERVVDELDDYLAATPRGLGPREPAVVDFAHLPGREIPWRRYLMTVLAAVVLSVIAVAATAGWMAAGLVAAIWIVALLVITSS